MELYRSWSCKGVGEKSWTVLGQMITVGHIFETLSTEEFRRQDSKNLTITIWVSTKYAESPKYYHVSACKRWSLQSATFCFDEKFGCLGSTRISYQWPYKPKRCWVKTSIPYSLFFVSNLYKGAKICDFDGDTVKLNLYDKRLEKSRVQGTAGKHKVILILD